MGSAGAASFIARKLVEGTITIFISITLAFFLFRIMPGDPTAVFLDVRLSPEAKAQLIRDFGLDKPLWEQYLLFLENIVKGNLGFSFAYRMPVSELIFGPKLINTLILMGLGIMISSLVSIYLGLLAAQNRGGRLDKIIMGLSYMVTSAPIYWIGLLILMIFAGYLGILPVSGTTSLEATSSSLLSRVADYLWHLAGPLTVITVYFMPSYLLYVRNTAVNLLGEDFILSLKAMGLSDKRIVHKHLRRHILPVVVTLIALQSPLLISGAIITETVFGWNGIGLLLYDSVLKADYPVVQSIFILTIIIVVIANTLAEIVNSYLDPRIRLGRGGVR